MNVVLGTNWVKLAPSFVFWKGNGSEGWPVKQVRVSKARFRCNIYNVWHTDIDILGLLHQKSAKVAHFPYKCALLPPDLVYGPILGYIVPFTSSLWDLRYPNSIYLQLPLI